MYIETSVMESAIDMIVNSEFKKEKESTIETLNEKCKYVGGFGYNYYNCKISDMISVLKSLGYESSDFKNPVNQVWMYKKLKGNNGYIRISLMNQIGKSYVTIISFYATKNKGSE